MNSVFKELLSRQLPVDATITPTSLPAPSSARPVPKKGGFGLRGRGLFKPADQQD